MKTKIFAIPCLLLAIVSSISAKNRCTEMMMTTDDIRYQSYQCLQATYDEVNYIPDGAQWISFSESVLLPLPARSFARFSHLSRLSFYNSQIKRIHADAFDGLKELQWLMFYGTTISELKSPWFKDMPNLTHLFLNRNDIVYIDSQLFSRIPSLIYLNIEDNHLNCLPNDILTPLTKLKHARIGKNPWLCSCYEELTGWMKSRQINYGETSAMKGELECMVEDVTLVRDFTLPLYNTFRNISVSENGYIQITAGQDVRCVGKDISILSQIPNNVQSIKFMNSLIPKIPRFAFLRFGNSLTALHFRNCGIHEIHPEAFAGLSKLEVLLLFNNSIGSVRSEWFRDLHNLQYLVLEKNEIDSIPQRTFGLLKKLKYWSLNENKLVCIPTDGFDSLKHLKEIVLTHNPWSCDCQDNFRRWLHEHRIRYVISRGPCVDDRIQDSEDLFEQIFEVKDAEFNSQTAHLADAALYPEQTNQDDKELYDEVLADVEKSENQYVEIMSAEVYHNHNIEISNREYENRLIRQREYFDALSLPVDYIRFEKTAMLDILPSYIDFFSPDYQLGDVMKYIRLECIFMKTSSAGKPTSYVSYGGTLWDTLVIPTEAMAIRFKNSAIPKIFSGIFSRFSNTLRVLEFLYCAVEDIEPQAFNELVNLQELILSDNQVQVIKAAWFEGTPNLLKLSLMRNSIIKIENSVFQLLPNLKQLEISGNKLNCLQFDALSYLTKLNTMYIGNNPWSCSCKKKLNQWLHEHGISYDEGALAGGVNWDCNEDYSSVKTNNIPDTNLIIDANVDTADELGDIQVTQASKFDGESITTTENLEIIKNVDIEVNSNFGASNVQTTTLTLTIVEPEHFETQYSFHHVDEYNSRWRCSGGDVSVLDRIPESAERIEFINADIPFIPANAFVRFPNLTGLLFYSSGIRNIDPLAFSTLNKLELLIFFNNSIPIIRSSWFRSIRNVTVLGLVRNSITEIEPDVFNFLPNLQRLLIQNNNLRCLYTKSLTSLKNLQKVTMQDNPWKWRCQEELVQYFEARNISYTKSGNYVGRCVLIDLLMEN